MHGLGDHDGGEIALSHLSRHKMLWNNAKSYTTRGESCGSHLAHQPDIAGSIDKPTAILGDCLAKFFRSRGKGGFGPVPGATIHTNAVIIGYHASFSWRHFDRLGAPCYKHALNRWSSGERRGVLGTLKASLIVISGLGALLGGAVVLRDGGVDSLAGITRVAQPPQQASPPKEPVAPVTEAAPEEAMVQELPEPAPLPALDEETLDASPRIDLVRLEPDGMALVSGTGTPDRDVEILVDGISVWSGPVDESGSFASFVQLPLSPIVRMMWLRQADGEGGYVQSDGSVLLAPSPEQLQAETPEAALTATAQGNARQVEEPTAQPEGDAAQYAAVETDDQTQTVIDETTAETSTRSDPEAVSVQPNETETAALSDTVSLTSSGPSEQTPIQTNSASSSGLATPTNLTSDAEGVRPLAPKPVSPEQGIAVDTVRYGAEGEVILAGRAEAADRELEIYLDNQVAATARTSDRGDWQVVLSDVPAGDYRLRADLSDQDGSVAARVDIPFRRETPERIQSARIAAEEADRSAALITVQPGFSLWAIARDRYGDGFQYVTVYEANTHQIVDPDLIYPGQVLTLPAATSTVE